MRAVVLSCVLMLAVVSLQAQHCPFDGTTVLTVQPDAPLKPGQFIVLHEIQVDTARKCSYTRRGRIDTLRHGPALDEWLKERFRGYFEEKSAQMGNFTTGNYAFFTNGNQSECVEYEGNNTKRSSRTFEIRLEENGTVRKRRTIDSSFFYLLCTSYGTWKRVQPVVI